METTIATGSIRINICDNTRQFGFEVRPEGIVLFALNKEGGALRLYEAVCTFADPTASVSGRGSIIFSAWPAAPEDGFYAVSLSVDELSQDAESWSLQITQDKPFARNAHAVFSELDLTLTQQTGQAPRVAPGSTLHLTVLGQTIALTGASDLSQGLVFETQNPVDLPIDGIGSMRVDGAVRASTFERFSGVQVLYTLAEGRGRTVRDSSQKGTPIALHAFCDSAGRRDSGRDGLVQWALDAAQAGLRPMRALRGSNRLPTPERGTAYPNWTSKGIALDGSFYLSSEHGGTRLFHAIRHAHAFSVEAWIVPQQGHHGGPAQILAFAGPGDTHWFTLAQGGAGYDSSFINIDVQYESPTHEWVNPLRSAPGSLPSAASHVVFTRDKHGFECIYINGHRVAERQGVNLHGWRDDFRLIIGSEPRDEPTTVPWHGEIRHLAVYDCALTATQIRRRNLPEFSLDGSFTLDNVPPPLANVAFASQLAFANDLATIRVREDVSRPVRPHLEFSTIALDLERTGDCPWTLTGRFQTNIWAGSVALDASHTGGRLHLFSNPQGAVKQIELGTLGPMEFKEIHLQVVGNDDDDDDDLDWKLSSKPHLAFAVIPLVLPREVVLDSDFKLVAPRLGLDARDVLLTGVWIGEPLSLIAGGSEQGLVLADEINFDSLFSLNLPALLDPDTGAELQQAIAIVDETMTIDLKLELQPSGFLGVLNSSFSFVDPSGTSQSIRVPESRLYLPPASKNALLGTILSDVRELAASLFEDQGRNAADYFVDVGTQQPFIRLSSSSQSQTVISSALPNIFTTDVQLNSPNSIFAIDQSGASCTLTLTTAGRAQTELREDYNSFLAAVTAAPITGAGGVYLLKRRIAERVPADYSHLLYYHYGWDTAGSYVDLQAGMRLRVSLQNYQFVQVSDPRASRGFVGSGELLLDINSYSHPQSDGTFRQLLGFGAFHSLLPASSAEDIRNAGAGGLVDLLRESNRQAFYRVFFPRQPAVGPGNERVATFVGTSTLPQLEAVTTAFLADNNPPGGDVSSFFLRGNAMVTPEIQVFVRNRAIWVPVGTTLRQLISLVDDIPHAGLDGQDLRAFAGSSRPLRLVHEGRDSRPEYRFVNLSSAGSVNNLDVLDLPLVKGDRFSF